MAASVTGRLYELDILRFVAAMSVVLYHYTYRRFESPGDVNPMFPDFENVSKFGYMGIYLFFMISGFVIPWTALGRSALQFMVSRVARLYPMFWCAVLITAAALLLLDRSGGTHVSVKTVAANFTMFAGYLGVNFIDGVYWTLQVELKFYLLVLLLILFRQIAHLELWLYTWLIAALYCDVFAGGAVIRSLTIAPYSSFFIAGALLFVVRTQGYNLLRGAALLTCLYLAVRCALLGGNQFVSQITTASSVSTVLIVVALFVGFSAAVLNKSHVVAAKYCYFLGALTYPLYLLHNRLGKLLLDYLSGSVNKYLGLLLVLLFILALSQLTVLVVERRLSRQFRKSLDKLIGIRIRKQSVL